MIDLNNNGVCDPGERYEYVQYRYKLFTISSKEPIAIHGEISYLDISNNKLTKLDLTAASKALTELYAHHNQITELDLAGMSNLKRLSLDSNQLTQLDVSSNEKLIMLAATDNALNAGSPVATTPVYNGAAHRPHIVVTEGCIELTDLAPGTQIELCSMTGISVATAESDSSGYAEISTRLLPQGVYLLHSAGWTERLLL